MSGDNNIPSVNIVALHDAIITQLAAQFPDVKTVADYPRLYKAVDLPALFLDLDNMDETAPDPGTEQLRLRLRWSIICMVSNVRTDGTPCRDVRALAASVATFIYKRRFMPYVGPARVTTIAPDAFNPDLDQYEVWRVEMETDLLQGVSAFDASGVVPSQVYLGITPKVGPAYKDDYIPVHEQVLDQLPGGAP